MNIRERERKNKRHRKSEKLRGNLDLVSTIRVTLAHTSPRIPLSTVPILITIDDGLNNNPPLTPLKSHLPRPHDLVCERLVLHIVRLRSVRAVVGQVLERGCEHFAVCVGGEAGWWGYGLDEDCRTVKVALGWGKQKSRPP